MPADDPVLPPVFRFGAFEADVRSGELRRAGVRIAIQSQPFQVLVRLLERPGEVVTREELRRELWSADTFVDFEHGLNVAVKRLRDALGDNASSPRFVETLPRRGYRFVAPVTAAGTPGRADDDRSDVVPTSWVRRFSAWWALGGLAVAVGLIGAGLLALRGRPAPLDRLDSILVADFVNKTGDEVFDGTLRDGLTVALAQSPSFTIVSRERVRDTLRQMTRLPDEPVAGTVAREVCQRAGAKVTVNGTIVSLGSRYAIGVEAVNCLSGETVTSEQVEVPERERILGALGATASRLRRRLGESLPSIQRFHVPLDQATTPSLDALKAFVVGRDAFLRTGSAESAIPFLGRAVELDPEFAVAYAWLSAAYASVGRQDEEIRHARQAYALRNRAGDQDRFYIDGRYCVVRYAPGFRTDCLMQVAEMWRRTYPSAWLPYSHLAAGHLSRGQYEEALEHGLQALRLNPEEGLHFINVVDAYMGLNRFSDARRVTDEALARQVVEGPIHAERFRLAFVAGDEEAMTAERQAIAGQTGEFLFLQDESEAAAFGGRLEQARLLRQRAEPLGRRESIAVLRANGMLIEAAAGLPVRVPRPSVSMSGVVRDKYAVATLLSGGAGLAEEMLRGGDSRPDRLPIVASALALAAVRKGDRTAIERLSDGTPDRLDGVTRFVPPYLRGLAYLQAGDAAHAAAEFQRIIDHRGVDPTSLLFPLAHLQQARAAVLAGDIALAESRYEAFLDFWKDADPDVPVLRQARTEHARICMSRD